MVIHSFACFETLNRKTFASFFVCLILHINFQCLNLMIQIRDLTEQLHILEIEEGLHNHYLTNSLKHLGSPRFLKLTHRYIILFGVSFISALKESIFPEGEEIYKDP